MAKWNPFRRRAVRVETKATLGTTASTGKFLLLGGGGQTGAGTASSAMSLYEQSSAISIPVNMVGDGFAVLDPILLTSDRRVIYEHPLLDLLRKPSPHFPAELFFEVLAKNYLVTGETAFVAKGPVTRPPLEIQPISPKNLTALRVAGSDVAQSWNVSGNSLVGVYEADEKFRYRDGGFRELKVIRNFSTKDNSLLRGQSLLVSASKEARQHILGGIHNVSLLENGGRVSLVFHFEEDLSIEDYDVVRERVREQYGGVLNAGEIGVTSGGKMTVKELSTTNKDMDFLDMQKWVTKSLALQFHVPLPLVTDERLTMNNYAIAKLALYDDAIIPLSGRIYGGLGELLLPRYGMDPSKIRITFDPDRVTSLMERRNGELKERKLIGIESYNELRAMVGREPFEGGDVILVPANMVPVGTDMFTADNAKDILEDPEI